MRTPLSVRNVLDAVATLCIIGAALVMMWSGVRNRGQAAPATAPVAVGRVVALDNSPVLGHSEARAGIQEFSDFQCPYCGTFVRDVLPVLRTEYIDKGLAFLVFRELPAATLHPRAIPAAQAAVCAHGQGRFWAMHDLLFSDPNALGDEHLRTYAASVGLEMTAFTACLSQKEQPLLDTDTQLAKTLSIKGTPTFLIGPGTSNGGIEVQQVIIGLRPVQEFRAALDAVLKSPGRN